MIEFTKMHGLGNDYIYIDCTDGKNKIKDKEKFVKKVSDRHFGIGSDGVIFIHKSKIADFKMQMFNSDGSEGKMCGNGIRCVGKFVYDNKLTSKTKLSIETLSGIKYLELNVINNVVKTVKVDMGIPEFNSDKIPMTISNDKEININIDDKVFVLNCVSMGNPHAVCVVDDLDKIDVEYYGKIIENLSMFPERINVEFIQIINRNLIKMRVWERGAGETLSCGTGACASFVIANKLGLVKDVCNVKLLGGELKIGTNKNNNHIYMIGETETIYEGKIIL